MVETGEKQLQSERRRKALPAMPSRGLPMAGHDQGRAPVLGQILRAFHHPFGIHSRGAAKIAQAGNSSNVVRERAGYLRDGTARNPQPMVRVEPGQGQEAFHDVQAVQRAAIFIDVAAFLVVLATSCPVCFTSLAACCARSPKLLPVAFICVAACCA